jgi:methyl-accepting chemotaxis protein/methyl-accepting chemotaxis protein-1 (serine sensor receptor)
VKKLLTLNAAALAMSALLAVLLVRTTTNASASIQDMAGLTEEVNHAQAIRKEMLVMGDSMRGFLLDPTQQKEWNAKMAADEALSKAVAGLLASTEDATRKRMAGEIGAFDEEHLNPSENRVLEVAKSDRAKATELYFNEYLPLRIKQMAQVEALLAEVQRDTDARTAEEIGSLESIKRMVFWFAGIGLALCAAALAWAWRTTGSVTIRIESSVTALTTSMDETTKAATQVADSSQALAQTSSEQAASLEETSASMEVMASLTRKNADNSKQAAAMMGETAQMVLGANAALDDMVASMGAIKESSRKVSKIIKTIDEIAFQTNILALNAAVEAARAGEAGMGFAIVADEVRSLAQRSAQAAHDTAALIEDSIASANAGNQKVEQVSGAIHAITSSAAQVKALVDAVSDASREQAQGIDQVTRAITEMERTTQATAASAEQSAAASEELSAQAETSLEVVGRLATLVGSRARQTPATPHRVARVFRGARSERRPTVASVVESETSFEATGTYGG